MTNKHWTLIGASYAIFAITTAALAQHQTSHQIPVDKPKVVAEASESFAISGQRMDQSNPRRDLFLTIWTIRNCAACTRQEAEIPALEEAGYNVILRKVPAPRWVKSFPTTVVTKDSPTGERVTDWTGFKTTKEIDSILKIGETPEDKEDPDYNIFSPRPGHLNLVVWLSDTIECDLQYIEITVLRREGFTANVYMAESKRPPRHITSTPTVILIDTRAGTQITVWRRFVTAKEILDTVH